MNTLKETAEKLGFDVHVLAALVVDGRLSTIKRDGKVYVSRTLADVRNLVYATQVQEAERRQRQEAQQERLAAREREEEQAEARRQQEALEATVEHAETMREQAHEALQAAQREVAQRGLEVEQHTQRVTEAQEALAVAKYWLGMARFRVSNARATCEAAERRLLINQAKAKSEGEPTPDGRKIVL